MVYVNNKDFYDLLVEYKKTKDRKIYNKIGKIFLLIAQRLLNKSNFINYSQDRKDEMISDSVYLMTKYINSFDPEKSNNGFSYFTQVSFNAIRHYINDKKIRDEIFVSIEKMCSKDSIESSNGYVVED